MTWIVSLVLGLLKTFLGHKTDTAKESGANEQKVTDLSASYDQLATAAEARAAADAERVLRQPGSGEVDSDPAKHYPSVQFRD